MNTENIWSIEYQLAWIFEWGALRLYDLRVERLDSGLARG